MKLIIALIQPTSSKRQGGPAHVEVFRLTVNDVRVSAAEGNTRKFSRTQFTCESGFGRSTPDRGERGTSSSRPSAIIQADPRSRSSNGQIGDGRSSSPEKKKKKKKKEKKKKRKKKAKKKIFKKKKKKEKNMTIAFASAPSRADPKLSDVVL